MNSNRVKKRSDDSVRMFVGLDLHKNYLLAVVVDDTGINTHFHFREICITFWCVNTYRDGGSAM